MPDTYCPCPHPNRYECWRRRYARLDDLTRSSRHDPDAVEADGGPCDCLCHDEPEDDE